MNILITTWTKYNNLGTQLQAYALQRKLILMGHNVATTNDHEIGFDLLDKKKQISKRKLYLKLGCSILKYPFNFKNRNKYKKIINHIVKEDKFTEFKRKYINLENNITDYRYLNNKYQVFICGSDQIWSPLPTVFSKFYYLDFVEKRNTKISYAPSMGQSICSKEFKQIIKPLLKSFDAISVREEQGKQILSKLTKKEISVVMDPTFLLSSNEWNKITSKNHEKGKYIFCYFLGENKWYREYSENISKKYNLNLLILSDLEIDKNNLNRIKEDVGPSEFLSYIKNAEYIITDSYHGVIFSLINEKNFVSVKRFSDSEKNDNQNSRLYNLFSKLKLTNRFVDENSIKDFYNRKINYQKIKILLNKELQFSNKYLERALFCGNGSNIISPMCTGCTACLNKCPVKAIKMEEDIYGEQHAIIDKNKCINCGLCKKICPSLNDIKLNNIKKCYGAINNEPEKVKECSSAGVAYELCKNIILKGGVIYGCIICNNMHIEHARIDNINDLEKIKGSKYTQSNLKNIFSNIKDDLKDKKVLFSGTPCQVAGLKAYLQKDYDNLILIDIACHGVTPQKHFIEYYKNINPNVKYVTFRNKENYYLTLYDNNKNIIYKKYKNKDPYLFTFLNNISLRENCYYCKYANKKRVGDISLGDFWGLDEDEHKSIVLINTIKGEKNLKQISQINLKEYQIGKSISNNDALLHPQGKSKYRIQFNKNLNIGYINALKKININKIIFINNSPKLYKKIIEKIDNKKNYIANDYKRRK